MPSDRRLARSRCLRRDPDTRRRICAGLPSSPLPALGIAACSPTSTGTVGGAAVGATAGAVVGGPVGAVVGGTVGAVAGGSTGAATEAQAPPHGDGLARPLLRL